MDSSIRRQLWETASGLAAGGGLGLLFELMRPLLASRRRLLRLGGELVYLLLAFAWVFLAGQLGGRGTPPLYLLLCAAGWLLCHGAFGAARRPSRDRGSSREKENCGFVQKMRISR